jgi:hypothetical protein
MVSGQELSIMVNGDDDGEQRTYILATREIKIPLKAAGIDMGLALRTYTRRVPNSNS